ncbi:uncharacterized protein [Clytia hemisphaerica]|uniref:uncharacterized protein n=1 Tax=Clytia hemisphaerica TaxID=252671 RepID=UPI0034D4AE3B
MEEQQLQAQLAQKQAHKVAKEEEDRQNEAMALWFSAYSASKPTNNNNNYNNYHQRHQRGGQKRKIENEEDRDVREFGSWVARGGFFENSTEKVVDEQKARAYVRYARQKKKMGHSHTDTHLEFGRWVKTGGQLYGYSHHGSHKKKKN